MESTQNIKDASELHELIKPQQVKFHSENLKNVLHWQPGSYKDNNTVYFVQYKMYGDKHWFHKQKCWGISSTFCDLTSETCDYSEPYFARVSAARISVQSDWVRTQTFTPRTETNIGPPSALVIPKKKSIKVRLTAPYSPLKGRNGQLISMEAFYKLQYRVYIIKNSLDCFYDQILDLQYMSLVNNK
nr:PREDICTED: interleukin-22 receptor subunit alpha-2-like [Latimeria chalumnae]|eukprot:XP_006014110.2 PREDICTED: interleukin-22 receptor subunit alpha-2-like [Latimeria chalumnae]